MSHAHFILREGGFLGDLYSMSDLMHDVDDVTLIQQGNDDDRVDRLGTGEAYLCQTKRRHCGEYHLTHGNGYGNKDAVEYIAGKRHPQVGTEPEHGTVVGQRGIDDVQLRREHEQFLHRLQGLPVGAGQDAENPRSVPHGKPDGKSLL